METLIQNLERRLICIRSIINLDLQFLEIIKLNNDNSSAVNDYQTKRTGAFRVLASLDIWVKKATDELLYQADNRVQKLLLVEQELFKSALESGHNVLTQIEIVKSDVVYNIRSLNRGKSVISAYRSGEERIDIIEKSASINKEA